MSQQELSIGKIKKVSYGTIEETALQLCKENNYLLEDYDSTLECLQEEGWEKYIFINNEIYEFIEIKNTYDVDIFQATKNEDGTISYVTSFYNGGMGLEDAIKECLKRIK
jgi:hypothetical protein